jgi:hypothetical protein
MRMTITRNIITRAELVKLSETAVDSDHKSLRINVDSMSQMNSELHHWHGRFAPATIFWLLDLAEALRRIHVFANGHPGNLSTQLARVFLTEANELGLDFCTRNYVQQDSSSPDRLAELAAVWVAGLTRCLSHQDRIEQRSEVHSGENVIFDDRPDARREGGNFPC